MERDWKPDIEHACSQPQGVVGRNQSRSILCHDSSANYPNHQYSPGVEPTIRCMAVSALDSLSQIPGFCDRLGERVIVPQASGALLEHLYFCDALAAAPFFAQALKDRVARLANFTPSSYCRVR